MARMPQIPEPEISSRPQEAVGHAEVNADLAAKPLQNLATGLGKVGAEIDDAQQDSADKLQKTADAVTATRMAGDHEVRLQNLFDQISKQYWDQPDKVPEEFRRQSLAMTDSEINAAPSQSVALDLARRNAQADNRHYALASSWSLNRVAQKAKSDLTGIERNAISSVAAAPTPDQFAYQLRTAHAQLDPLYGKLTSNAGKAAEGFDQKVAQEWVARNADPLKNPLGVIEELQKDGGPVRKLLTAEQTERGLKQARAAWEGAGVMARVAMLTRAHDGIDDLNSLAAARDPKFLKTTAALRDEVNAHVNMLAQQAITPQAKDQIRAGTQKVMEAIDHAEQIYRSQSGVFRSDLVDEPTRKSLIERSNALFAGTSVPPGDALKEMLDLRADNNRALAEKKIPESTWKTIEDKLSKNFSKMNAAKSQDTGSFLWQQPEQAGNQRINDLLDPKVGRYANATQKQRNDIWERYLQAANAAGRSGGKFDKDDARKAADDAAEFVMSQRD